MPAIDLLVPAREHALVPGFSVRRVLPWHRRRNVGPFVFLDHLGPVTLPPGQGMDVGPHPHIGLATVTYLFAGRVLHRDSLGSVQSIVPGDVNWMTAGRGIVHSERTPEPERAAGGTVHGVQIWVALPAEDEEIAPAFAHHAGEGLPHLRLGSAEVTVIAGTYRRARSPVATRSPLLLAAARMPAGADLPLAADYPERALYVVSGALAVDGEPVLAGTLAVLTPQARTAVASDESLALLLAGAPLGPRRMEWNFVSSTPGPIERAKREWTEGRLGTIPGEGAPIPLPE